MIPVKPEIRAGAHIRSMEEYQRLYRLSLDDPEGFWKKQADNITWFHPPSTISTSTSRRSTSPGTAAAG